MKLPSLSRAGGFTLIELLVVLAIIAILASLLLVTIASQKAKVARIQCTSNLRQIGFAMLMYAEDHEGFLPSIAHGAQAKEDSWIMTLAPYMGGAQAIRACPSDRAWKERLEHGGTCFLLNGFAAFDAVDHFGEGLRSYRNLNQLRLPGETILLFEISDRAEPTIFKDHTHSRGWLNGWGWVLLDIQPDRHRSGPPNEDHTRGAANYLFADGRVGLLPAMKLKEALDQGINPAEPPD
jgi:prepilin-type N-terminal cleavage/methylation domain-containing protein/prepilin-type processing-associated H-X9-DG protein